MPGPPSQSPVRVTSRPTVAAQIEQWTDYQNGRKSTPPALQGQVAPLQGVENITDVTQSEQQPAGENPEGAMSWFESTEMTPGVCMTEEMEDRLLDSPVSGEPKEEPPK